jgi:hypothetical protein
VGAYLYAVGECSGCIKKTYAQLQRFKESIEKNDDTYLMKLIDDANKIGGY